MTNEEKVGSAIFALKMIAAQTPKKDWVESGYNNGGYVGCPVCEKLINMAKDAVKLLENVK